MADAPISSPIPDPEIPQPSASEKTLWGQLSEYGETVSGLHMPAGIAMGVIGLLGDQYIAGNPLRERPMSDDWVGQVAAAPDVSAKGLAFLAKRLIEQGFVSAQDALDWIRLEKAERDRVARLPGEGARKLLERAQRECGPELEADWSRRIASGIKAAPDIALGALSKANPFSWGSSGKSGGD